MAEARANVAADLDLLISDIELPDGTGLELMREIGDEQNLPGIAMSGFGSEEDVRFSREAGFAVHLTKPIDLARLEAAIDAVRSPVRVEWYDVPDTGEFSGSSHHAIFMQFFVERHPADAELRGGAEAVVLVPPQGIGDPKPLGVILGAGESGHRKVRGTWDRS